MTTPLRVLMVEDSESDAEIMARLLRKAGYELVSERVDTAGAMRAALQARSWDAVIADCQLARFDAPAALELLHESGLDVPFIVISGTVGEEVAVAMMKAGAHGYLTKDELLRLPPAIDREIRQAQTRREAKEALQALRRSEGELAEAQAIAHVGNWRVAFAGGEEVWSGSAELSKLWSIPPSTAITSEAGFGRVHPDDRERVRRIWSAAKRGEGREPLEFRIVVDGEVKWLQTRAHFTRDPNGVPLEGHGTVQDITDRKLAETRERHLKQVLRAIREVSKLVIRAKDRQHLIREACEILIAARGYDKAWIALDPDGSRPLTLASAGWGEAFGSFERRLKGGYRPSCFEKAAVSPQLVAVLDPWVACGECPLKLAVPEGAAGVATLRHEREVYGRIGIRVPGGLALDADERTILHELAGDLAFALHTIDSEERRRASEERFRVSFEKAAVGQALTSCDGRLVRVNEALARMLDYDPAELEGRTLADLTHPDDFASSAEAMRALLSGAPPQRLEKRHLRRDGEVVWLELTFALLRDSAGAPEHFIVTAVNRTGSRQAQAALRVQEERLRLAVEGAALATWHWDIPSGQLIWSDRCYAMFGVRPRAPMTHEDFLRLLHPEDRALVQQAIDGALTGSLYDPEFRVCWADGSVHWIAAKGRCYNDGRGRPVRLEGVARDVTDQRRLEAELRQAQKMEAVGRLAGGVAHDFNNILGVIQGRCELMLKTLREDDPLFRHLSLVQSSGERAAALTRQLLAFSRQQPLQPEVLDLNESIRNLAGMLKRLIGEHIEFATTLAEDLGRVKADPSQIEQVIINMAVNARDAMPDGGKLLVETANVELDDVQAGDHVTAQAGRYVLLAVSDTGCGMDKETKDRIFEPFFTTKEKGKGTGLGLATVYGIVKQSGGYVWAYSEVGRGSTFKVYLPRTDEPAAEPARPAQVGSLEGHGERILVVEDDSAMREVVRDLLEDLGYQTTVAANGGEALLAIEEGGLEPDLLVTDCVMPGISGELLAERLRRTQPGLRVLFMSGYTDQSALRHGVLRQGSPFIQKPFRSADLAAKVKAVLSQPAAQA